MGDAVGRSETMVGDAVLVVGVDVYMSITLQVTPAQQYAPWSHSACFPNRQCVSTEQSSTAPRYVAPQKKEFDVALYPRGESVGATLGGVGSLSRMLHSVSAKQLWPSGQLLSAPPHHQNRQVFASAQLSPQKL